MREKICCEHNQEIVQCTYCGKKLKSIYEQCTCKPVMYKVSGESKEQEPNIDNELEDFSKIFDWCRDDEGDEKVRQFIIHKKSQWRREWEEEENMSRGVSQNYIKGGDEMKDRLKILYFKAFDTGLFNATQEIRHRVIKIELNAEQSRLIEPRITGKNHNEELTEIITPIGIEEVINGK